MTDPQTSDCGTGYEIMPKTRAANTSTGVAYCYTRISTDVQTAENQKIYLQNACKRRNLTPVIYSDLESRTTDERAGIDRMFADIQKNPPYAIIVYRMDRVGPSLKILGKIFDLCRKYNVVLISESEGFDSSTEFGKTIMSIMALLSGIEVAGTRDRTRIGLQRVRETGSVTGRMIGNNLKPAVPGVEKTKKQWSVRTQRDIAIRWKNWIDNAHLPFKDRKKLGNSMTELSRVFNCSRKIVHQWICVWATKFMYGLSLKYLPQHPLSPQKIKNFSDKWDKAIAFAQLSIENLDPDGSHMRACAERLELVEKGRVKNEKR